MIEVKSRVRIVPSKRLNHICLGATVGMKGVVTQLLTSPTRKLKGFIVKLDELFMDEEEWFFPNESVVSDDKC